MTTEPTREGAPTGVPSGHEDLVDEVRRLRKWKAEALPVIAGLQDLGRALGLAPGVRITGRTALDAALDLRNFAQKAEAEVERLQAVEHALSRELYEDGGWIERATNAEARLDAVRALAVTLIASLEEQVVGEGAR